MRRINLKGIKGSENKCYNEFHLRKLNLGPVDDRLMAFF